MTTAITEQARPRVARGHRMQWEEAQDCHVLLYPEGMVTLNGSAYEILSRCDGERRVAEIVADLEQTFPEADLADEVYEFLRLAEAQGWLQV